MSEKLGLRWCQEGYDKFWSVHKDVQVRHKESRKFKKLTNSGSRGNG